MASDLTNIKQSPGFGNSQVPLQIIKLSRINIQSFVNLLSKKWGSFIAIVYYAPLPLQCVFILYSGAFPPILNMTPPQPLTYSRCKGKHIMSQRCTLNIQSNGMYISPNFFRFTIVKPFHVFARDDSSELCWRLIAFKVYPSLSQYIFKTPRYQLKARIFVPLRHTGNTIFCLSKRSNRLRESRQPWRKQRR